MDKKEKQAKNWRELRKRQRQASKSIELFKDDSKDEPKWLDGFKPLTDKEQKKLAYFLATCKEDCLIEHYDTLKELGKAYSLGRDQAEIGLLEHNCYMAMGRESIYELLLAFLCPGALKQDYRGYILRTADEWKEKSDEKEIKA